VRRWRAILRPNRPELRATFILGLGMLAVAGGAIAWLHTFHIPDACFGNGDIGVDCQPYMGTMMAYGEALETAGNPAAIAVVVVPILVAMVLGIALLGREIEQQTTNFAWSIAPSRAAWLGDRLVPILLLLITISVAAGGLGDLLMGLRLRGVDPWHNFEALGLRGPAVAGAALLVFGIAGLIGGVVGRQLPALLISGAVIGLGVYGAFAVSEAFVQGDAVVAASNQVAIGDKFLDTLIRTPEGEFITWNEAYERYGSAVDEVSYEGTSTSSGLSVVVKYVPGERYPAAVARLTGLLGVGGAAAIALTFLVVHRRRPY
jgi:hypothetical protein